MELTVGGVVFGRSDYIYIYYEFEHQTKYINKSPVIVHKRADFAFYKLCGFIKCVG